MDATDGFFPAGSAAAADRRPEGTHQSHGEGPDQRPPIRAHLLLPRRPRLPVRALPGRCGSETVLFLNDFPNLSPAVVSAGGSGDGVGDRGLRDRLSARHGDETVRGHVQTALLQGDASFPWPVCSLLLQSFTR